MGIHTALSTSAALTDTCTGLNKLRFLIPGRFL